METINGRTPEEIKRWVDGRATCNTCPKEHEVGCEDGERTEDCQMTIDTIAYIERLESERDAALAKVPKWTSVKDGLPKPFVSVQVYMPGEAPLPTVREGFLTDKGVWHAGLYDREPGEVTHWTEMERPPEVQG